MVQQVLATIVTRQACPEPDVPEAEDDGFMLVQFDIHLHRVSDAQVHAFQENLCAEKKCQALKVQHMLIYLENRVLSRTCMRALSHIRRMSRHQCQQPWTRMLNASSSIGGEGFCPSSPSWTSETKPSAIPGFTHPSPSQSIPPLGRPCNGTGAA